MSAVPHQVFDSELVSLEAARTSRDLARFQKLSPLEQWQEIDQSWPVPLSDALASDSGFQRFLSGMKAAKNRLEALADISDTAREHIFARVGAGQPAGTGQADPAKLAEIAGETERLAAATQACLDEVRALEASAVALFGRVKPTLRTALVRHFNRLVLLIPVAIACAEAEIRLQAHGWNVEKTLICFRLVCLCIEAEAGDAPALAWRLMSGPGTMREKVDTYLCGGADHRRQLIDHLGDTLSGDAPALYRFQAEIAGLWADGAPAYVKGLLPASLWSR